MNNSPIYERIEKILTEKKQSDLFRTISPSAGTYAIDLSTNSYLWLHKNAEVAEEASRLIAGQFNGNCASRLVSFNSPLFIDLEAQIAAWKRTESALLFNSGYAANLGIIQAIGSRDTEVFSDDLNHASIIDGIRLSHATVARFKHCDMEDLKRLLEASKARYKIIITDSVFSMHGDCAPLSALCTLAAQFNCMVMVDEAHAAGVFGETGSGLVEALGLENQVDIRMGTLSKSIAGMGGFFAGQAILRDFFVNSCRSLIYSTALPHAALAWDFAALRHIRKHPGIGKELLLKAQWLRNEFKKAGFNTLASTTHIIPLVVGDEKSALSLSAHLKKNGIKAPAIRPPTVPPGFACVRFSVHSGLTDDDLKKVAQAVKEWDC
jgi:8-amino-7-oxononanoate synthase